MHLLHTTMRVRVGTAVSTFRTRMDCKPVATPSSIPCCSNDSLQLMTINRTWLPTNLAVSFSLHASVSCMRVTEWLTCCTTTHGHHRVVRWAGLIA